MTDRRSLLPDGQVGRPLVVVLDALINALSLDLLQHVLEFTNEKHVLINSHKRFGPVGFQLLLRRSGVLVKWNLRANQLAAFAFLLGFNYL